MAKLTKRVVDGAKPGAILWDDDLGGFGLRTTPGGSKAYVLDYRTKAGVRRRLTVCRADRLAPDEARSLAIGMLAQVACGEDPAVVRQEERAALPISDLCELYLREGPAAKPTKTQRSWSTDASNIQAHIEPLIGGKQVKALTTTDVENLQRSIANGKTRKDERTRKRGRAIVRGGPGIAARSIRVLSAMYSFAVRRGLAATNPCRGVALYKGKTMERFLSTEELARLGDAFREAEAVGTSRSAVAAIRLLVLTGCRKTEIAALRWEHIDFERKCLNLPYAKRGWRSVPIGAAARELLMSLRPKKSGWVLPASRGDGHIVGLQKVWDGVRARAQLSDVRIHDLRHSFASVAVAAGESLYLIGKVLGHKQARTTERYVHLSNAPLVDVADRTGARIVGAMAGGDSPPTSGDVVPLKR